LKPLPHIVEVDLRGKCIPIYSDAAHGVVDDDAAIKGLLVRLTGHSTFPNIILKGKSLGGYDSLQLLHDTGDLEHELEKAGITLTGNVHGD